MLVGVAFGGASRSGDSLDELAALAVSAGLTPVERTIVRRSRPDAALFIGSGKAEEIGARLAEAGVALVLFDHELSPIQQRNLSLLWDLPVMDRTELILDIFARRARSHEGKLQVELARLEHLSARLVRGWTHLERQRGGIGVRGGPGETQLELDRRMLSVRVKRLRAQLGQLRKQRRTRRRARDRRPAFTVSIVGYTNAGKSTLFNGLTGAGTYAADKLFATLDTLTRRLRLPSGTEAVVSDTVGFVRDLPHQLVEAFTATLEETAAADLLLHVVDASAPDRDEQIAQVDRVLEEIGAGQVPRILVYNKIDRIGRAPEVALDRYGRIDRVWTSAAVGVGLDLLREAIDQQVSLWRDARRHGAAAGAQDADADAAESLEHPEHRAA
ncbi:MAG: GTPase HflX [Lautropia sp.]|nr:MAG: GTPase HflX [Pseudomonadota bacterium]MBC6960484.1 GTPase HflX [Lautropia sp.]MCL4700865.1 GTPase HflX [Burkholderiaceae bacterium]MDL1908352.1 GTPase HflX [Betaproteobacteria bacterium PRO1]